MNAPTARSASHAGPKAWYREPWPWLLMLGPGLVIIAACYTAYLAVVGQDSIIADDYYTQGLHINQLLARDSTAARLGLKASAQLGGAHATMEIEKNGASLAPAAGEKITLVLAHTTRGGLDQQVVVQGRPDGVYMANISPLAPGSWNVSLEAAAWRLSGQLHVLPGRTIGPLELAPGA